MKNIVKVAFLGLILLITTGNIMAGKYTVDNTKSTVKWNGKKVTGEHYGTIRIQSGSLEVKNNKISSATVEIDMNSIVCEDLTDAGTNGRLVGHLKSDDFFSVAKFPSAKLVLSDVKQLSGNEFEFTGNLTIKGITNPVTFKATSVTEGKVLKANGQVVVNRAKYDVRYGSKSFFADLGDKMIYDDFTLNFSLVANQD